MKLKYVENVKVAEFIALCFMAISSGLVIGISATAFLTALSYFGTWGKLIGAGLFSFGIFTIISFEMRLFTGMVADMPTMGVKNYWKLPVCFICNSIGVALIALLAYHSPISSIIVPQAQAIVAGKLGASGWALKNFCSSILCGTLITLSVKATKRSPAKGLSATVGVMFPIIVFAFCGFDHSVANMMYFYYFGEFSWRVVGYVLITIVGNVVGGVGLSLFSLMREHEEKIVEENSKREG
jgi:formate/nitrite transporter FocA (FNT family)